MRNAEFDWGDTYRSTSPLPLKHRIPKRPRPPGKPEAAQTTNNGQAAARPNSAATPTNKQAEPAQKPAQPAVQTTRASQPSQPYAANPGRVVKSAPVADELTEQLLPISGSIRTLSPLKEPTKPIGATLAAETVVKAAAPPEPAVLSKVETLEPAKPALAEPIIEPEPAPVKSGSPLNLDEQPGLAAGRAVAASQSIEPKESKEKTTPTLYYKSTVKPSTSGASSTKNGLSPATSVASSTKSAPSPAIKGETSSPAATISTTPAAVSAGPSPRASVDTNSAATPVAEPESEPVSDSSPIQEDEETAPSTPTAASTSSPYTSVKSTPPIETTSPMKSSSPYTSNSSSSTLKTVAPASTGGVPPRNSGIPDYKSNIERQAREQKSVGGLLSIIVYCTVAVLLLGGGLAFYGLYVLKQQVSGQAVTISDLQHNFEAKTTELQNRALSTQETLNQALAQMNRENEVIVQQADQINKLIKVGEDQAAALTSVNNSLNTTTAALARERSARVYSVEDMKEKIHHLENRVEELRAQEASLASAVKPKPLVGPQQSHKQ